MKLYETELSTFLPGGRGREEENEGCHMEKEYCRKGNVSVSGFPAMTQI